MNPPVQLHVDGRWTDGYTGRTIPILNPASAEAIGHVACADIADLDRALLAADRGFNVWKNTAAMERYRTMRRAAQILDSRTDEIARVLTIEQGKPLTQAKFEVA